MKRRNVMLIALICAGICRFISCTGNTAPTKDYAGGEGTGSETICMVYNANLSPADSALVRFVPDGYQPDSAGADTLMQLATDAAGFYAIPQLPAGIYNIEFQKDGNVAFRDSVVIAVDSAGNAYVQKSLIDTLQAPGSITGVIGLQEGDDSRRVDVYLIGTGKAFTPDDSVGNFRLTNLAAGRYDVRFEAPNHAILDTQFTVISGMHDTLQDTIYLDYLRIPKVGGLSSAYDSLMQLVSLAWQAIDTAKIDGYDIYRRPVDSIGYATKLRRVDENTLSFTDSTAKQGETYYYAVRGIDATGSHTPALTESAPVNIASAFPCVKVIDSTTLPAMALLQRPVDMAAADGRFFIADEEGGFVAVVDTGGDSLALVGQVTKPTCLDVFDSSIYVTDNANAAYLSVFNYAGLLKHKIKLLYNAPDDIAVTNNNRIYLLYNLLFKIICIDTNSNLVYTSKEISNIKRFDHDFEFLYTFKNKSVEILKISEKLEILSSFDLSTISNQSYSRIALFSDKFAIADVSGENKIQIIHANRNVYARFNLIRKKRKILPLEISSVEDKFYFLTNEKSILLMKFQ
ncbi:MAG: hypothetical protein GF398_03150 [Chitinivibrionales bacterium]|nr:hypothetical protein [Chitinivibrionales bacterium]